MLQTREALILVRYHPTSVYKLYNSMSQQVVISIDVTVDDIAL